MARDVKGSLPFRCRGGSYEKIAGTLFPGTWPLGVCVETGSNFAIVSHHWQVNTTNARRLEFLGSRSAPEPWGSPGVRSKQQQAYPLGKSVTNQRRQLPHTNRDGALWKDGVP